MSHRIPRLVLAAAAATVVALAATASTASAGAHMEAKAPQMFVIHTEHAVPSKVAEFEATTKEFVALVQANRSAMPTFAFTALQGEDLSYSFVTPIKNLADADVIYAGFEALGKAAGERFVELMRRAGATYTSVDEAAFVEVPEASYWPAGAEVTPMNAGYYQLDLYRPMPGMDMEAAQVAAGWKQLFESKKVPYGYSVFRLVLGSDGPLWVVSTPAKDPANLAAIAEGARKAIGEEAWRAQLAKTMAISRSFETKRYWVRRDLSLAPPAAAGK